MGAEVPPFVKSCAALGGSSDGFGEGDECFLGHVSVGLAQDRDEHSGALVVAREAFGLRLWKALCMPLRQAVGW